MQPAAALRGCMMALVLLNLVLVQITGAAGFQWLAPLFVLTVISPLLARFQERLWYRGFWNLVGIGVFAKLVHNATILDLQNLLESGLVMAALCQVHLLNNLRRDQQPDLLFFNSFLIALVTGYLSQDLVYSVVFLVYAPFLVVGLQLLCVTRVGREIRQVMQPGTTRPVVIDGLKRSAALLAVTLLVFMFWPRDFSRKGVFGSAISLPGQSPTSEIAFSDQVKLGQAGKVVASDRVAMVVRPLRGSPADIPGYWRGATMPHFDGVEWRGWIGDAARREMSAQSDPWRKRRIPGVGWGFKRKGDRSGAAIAVKIVDPRANRLFVPLSARMVKPGEGARAQVIPQADHTLEYGKGNQIRRPDVNYEVMLTRDRPRQGGTPVADPPWFLVQQPPAATIQAAMQTAERLTASLPQDTEQHEIVERLRLYVAEGHQYLAPGEEDAAQTLDEFLRAGKGAHCEFFATALAVMLRHRQIPCRLATGYRSGDEWDANQTELTIRARDAHSWVEVLDPEGGWYTVDPSPAMTASQKSGESLLAKARSAANWVWERIVQFDQGRRDKAIRWLKAAPGRLLSFFRSNPIFGALGILALALGFTLARMRRMRGIDPAVRAYRKAVKRSGLTLAKGETPREFLRRVEKDAAAGRVSDKQLRLLETATNEHERARYAVAK